MSDDLQAQLDAAYAEIESLKAGASAHAGPGTPEHFYSVGGVGDEVVNPATGEVLLNPQTGTPIIQEHPDVAAQAATAAARAKVEKAAADLATAEAALSDALAAEADTAARWDEIVADLVARSEGAE